MFGSYIFCARIFQKFQIRRSRRQIMAILGMLALLMPIGIPVPAWAFDLDLPPNPINDSPSPYATSPSLVTPGVDFASTIWNNVAALIGPKMDTARHEPNTGAKEALEAKVTTFETQLEGEKQFKVGQGISLAALPLDKRGNVVNGLAAKWRSSNPSVVKIANDSQAIALSEGEAKLTVFSDKSSRDFIVRVINNVSSTSSAASSLILPDDEIPIITEQQAENMVYSENNLGNPPGQTEAPSLTRGVATRTRERYGSSNYSFDIPIASIPGRGLDAGIGTTYNSRVWNKADYGSERVFTFNVDSNWLAPGFALGYGFIEGYSTTNGYGYILTDSDGTRHQLTQRSSSGSCITYESTDGTYIQTTTCGYSNPIMVISYSDGSQITFGSWTSGRRFPIQIRDRNGNFITIAYIAGDTQGKIAYIRDTLNRYINFHYESAPENATDKKLVAVSVPGYGTSPERQTIRFYYEDMPLQTTGRFETPVTVNAPETIKVLRFVYFPGTQTGYRYDYSPYYGTICKIWQLRGMQVSTTSTTETGTVTVNADASNWAAWTHYNYAATAMELGAPLTDVPKWNLRKDDWQGRTSDLPQTQFQSVDDTLPAGCQIGVDCTGTRTVTVTAPDGTKSISVSNIRPSGDWQDGLLAETSLETIENGSERIWSKTAMYWEQGDNQPTGRDNPRLDRIEVTNDANQTRATGFDYDSFNNQITVKEYDFAAPGTIEAELTLLRETDSTYETGTGWINNRLLRLPKEIKAIARTVENNVVSYPTVSKVQYEYDNYQGENALVHADGVMQHLDTYDPYTGNTHECNCRWSCDGFFTQSYEEIMSCPDGYPPTRTCDRCSNYDSNSTFRGNVTKTTAFSDASLMTDSNALVTQMKYDITGNVVEADTSCCKVKSWTFNNTNGYAYPISEARGDESQLLTSYAYDLNTGLVNQLTDENNQRKDLTYNPNNLRVIRTDMPDTSWTAYEYNDAIYPYYVKTSSSLDAGHSIASWTFSDGQERSFRTRQQTANGFLSDDLEFDIMGRAQKSYNSYAVGNFDENRPQNVKYTKTTSRDGLGRPLSVTLPDLTTVSATYSGLIETVTDQAGKSRRKITDVLGRIMRVDEPDESGSLGSVESPSQPTNYEYDGNDNLIKVSQSDGTIIQERLFKYDSLSRLTHERQVEATATLSSDGVKVTSGGLWTGVYKYNNKGLLTEGYDARGVKTSFDYDGLNRIHTVIYSGETGYQTPQATYTYDESESGFYNNGRLTKVQTAANTTYGTPETVQSYRYNKVGQIVKHTQTIGSQSYQLLYGYNLAGMPISEVYPSGKTITTTVDNFGVIQSIADGRTTYLNGVTFDSRGLLSQINYGNGTSEIYSQNDRFQVESQSLMKGADLLQKYDYFYGKVDLASGSIDLLQNNGRLAKMEAWIGSAKQWSERFGFDELDRLSEIREYKQGDNSHLTYKQVFDFDRFGNLYRKSSKNPTTGQENPLPTRWIEGEDINRAKNQITTDTSYDDGGAVVTDDKFRNMSFVYDANYRMVKASKDDQPDAWTLYDGLGNRVAEKVHDSWDYMIYDTFGHLVAEYSPVPTDGSGGVKYIHQDRQGNIRVITNANGFVIARSDRSAFGEEIGLGIGLRSREQGYLGGPVTLHDYARTERDDATGLNHALFRKLEIEAGRWTSPDPYKKSMNVLEPQSFNRYSYVTNDPVNFVDPSGLYEGCVHKVMTKYIGQAANLVPIVSNKLAHYASDESGGADSFGYAATSPQNIANCEFGFGWTVILHFPSTSQLATNVTNYSGYLQNGLGGSETGYQMAGFMIHSIEDALGAHSGYTNDYCKGHAADGHKPDRIIGDKKFIAAANKVFQVMSGDPNANLTNKQINELVDLIKKECGKKYPDLEVHHVSEEGGGGPVSGSGGGDLIIYSGQGISDMDLLWWLYNQWLDAQRREEDSHLG